jgi:predicted acylesterase/phospholipase RssA
LENAIISLVSALIGAVVGALFSSYLTKKIQKEMIEEQKKHRIQEIKFLRLEALLYNYIKWENQFIRDCSKFSTAVIQKDKNNFNLETHHPNVAENVNYVDAVLKLHFEELIEPHERVNFTIEQLVFKSFISPHKCDFKEITKLFDNFLDASKEFKEEIVKLYP